MNLRGTIEDCVSAEDWKSPSFKCIIDSIQDIFESYASLDDPLVEPDDYFGLTVGALKETFLKEDEEKSESSAEDLQEEVLAADVETPAPHEPEPQESLTPHPTPTGLASTNSSNVAIKTPDNKKPQSANDTKPKRPLSAYNLFFQLERERLIAGIDPDTPFTAEDVERVAINRRLMEQGERPKRKHRKSHGKISFAELARKIANKWKTLNPDAKDLLQERAAIEKARYLRELETWTTTNNETQRAEFVRKLAASNSSEMVATSSPPPSQSQHMDGSFHMVTPDQYHQSSMYADVQQRHGGNWNTSPVMPSPMPQYSSSFDNYHSATVSPPFSGSNSFDTCETQRCQQAGQQQDFHNAEYEAYSMAERTGIHPSTIMQMINELDVHQQHQQQVVYPPQQQYSYDHHPHHQQPQQQQLCRVDSQSMASSSAAELQSMHHHQHQQLQHVASHGVRNEEW